MANLNHKRPYLRAGRSRGRTTPFRVIDWNRPLEESGYYEGFPCLHGHTTRHMEHHYCYFCAQRIISNFVGLDTSFIHEAYSGTTYKVLKALTEFGDFNQCWPELQLHSERVPRFSWPTWKTAMNGHRQEAVKIGKILYTMFWGDPGKLSVTRSCSNKTCCNPLHLTTSLNLMPAPRNLSYFSNEYSPEKMLLMGKRILNKQSIDDVLRQYHKPRITNPNKLQEEVLKRDNYIEITWSHLQNNES